MVRNSKKNKLNISLKKFVPFFLLEIIITSTTGSLATAISNNLISELNYAPWVGAVVVSLTSAGFLIFTLSFGHISDKYSLRNVIIVIHFFRLGCSFFYLLPITSNIHLIFFGLIFFLDGGANGLFWPTIQQISVLTEKFGGLRLKQKYMSGYNFSWNFGYIFGMFAGTIIVYLFNLNYFVFYFNAIGLIIGVIIAIFSVRNMSEIFSANKISGIDSQQNSAVKIKEEFIPDKHIKVRSKLPKFPLYSLLIVLLVHSLTDGVLTIFLTLKIVNINQDLYWVFLITLIKVLSQMIATMVFSFTKKGRIAKLLLLSIIMVLGSWVLISLSDNLLSLALLLAISGFGQGMIYALIMSLISYKARDKNSAKPFSYFQVMMSGGRMMGSLIFGLTSTVFLNLGIIILIFYEIVAFIQFSINWKNAS
ncbi:MAG: MFS transporter [Promethearchaeota archaeon]|jgi:MFS family permease